MAQTLHLSSQFSPTIRFLPPKLFLIHRQFLNLGFQIKFFNNNSMSVKCVNTSMAAPEVTVKDKIDLTEKEEIIFNRLLDVLKHFDLDTQLRVAGGWVRDKLLGKDCYDIDIALDNMLGREFCEKVNEYLKYTGEEEQGKVAVIQSNPDQSKHLETARMWIYETWIDFVNLRSETYMENSRIPMMKFGTAKEDAYRRDLTINSLFYNINTKSVEDFTGRGVQDLKNRYIATPLPPKSTFLDDPLRVLRAIRFGARFDFELDNELKIAASDDEVKTSLAHKISRERIGHEVDLMISGNHPVKAITHICDLQLFFVVFALPANQQLNVHEGCDRDCVFFMDASWKLLQFLGFSKFSDEQNKLYLYGSLFLPLRNTVYIDRKSKKFYPKAEPPASARPLMMGRDLLHPAIPVTSYIIRDSLKLKANYADIVVSLHSACEKFISLIPLLESMDSDKICMPELEDEFLVIPETSEKRVLTGLLLRQIKDYWRVALLMSTLIHMAPIQDTDASHIDLDGAKDIYLRVESTIIALDLDKVWDLKPLLDGKAIMAELKLEKGGPLVREWQERLLKWQLAYPEATAEECLQWMRRFQTKRAKLE